MAGNDKENCGFYIVLLFPPFCILVSPKYRMCRNLNMKVELPIYLYISASYQPNF